MTQAETSDNLRRRLGVQRVIDATEYRTAQVTYRERLYVSSTTPRMNDQPFHLAVDEPEWN
jgi:hypothetical protein